MGCCCKREERRGERRESKGEGKRGGKRRGEEENCTAGSSANPFASGKQLKSASALNPKQTFFLQWTFWGNIKIFLHQTVYFLRFTQGDLH